MEVASACWKHPLDQYGIANKSNHPVVQIAYEDALAYAIAGKRLPTEAEWEWAAKGDFYKILSMGK